MIKHIVEESFETEVLKNKGIVLLDFYASWCGPCMRLIPILEELTNSRTGYNIIKVDVDECPNISSKLNIDTIPTLCLYKDGKLIEKQIGYRKKEEIIELLEKYT